MPWWNWLEKQWSSHSSEFACFFAALSLILGLLALIQWGELRGTQIPADWGSVPDWVAALGTVAAFGALTVAVFQWRASLASQARLIVVQPARDDANPSTVWLAEDNVIVMNHSDSPVFDLEIGSLEYSSETIVWEDLRATNVHAPAKRPVFRPGEQTGLLTVVGAVDGGREAATPKIQYLDFSFTDADGRRWRRKGTGQPVRVYGRRTRN